jgi:rod shape-determining protein MreD
VADGRGLRIAGTVGLLVAFHFLLHVGLSWGRGAPDLLTVAVLLTAREARAGTAAAAGLVAGLLEDALSVLSFGANSVAMTVVGIAGALTRDLFVGDSRFFLFAYLFLGKVARDFVHWLAAGEAPRQAFVDQVLLGGAVSGAYVAVIGWVVAGLSGVAWAGRNA